MDTALVSIENLLSRYFDGLYNSDTGLLGEVFHPRAHYVSATDGGALHYTMDEYFPVVDKRPSPASRGEKRNDRIISIAFSGPAMAFAQVNCSIGEKMFTDFLTIIFADNQWQIISKVFHYDLIRH